MLCVVSLLQYCGHITAPSVKGITHCLLPECNNPVWPFMNYCGRNHADIGRQRGLQCKLLLHCREIIDMTFTQLQYLKMINQLSQLTVAYCQDVRALSMWMLMMALYIHTVEGLMLSRQNGLEYFVWYIRLHKKKKDFFYCSYY